MNLHSLSNASGAVRRKKRVGRGMSSGSGKTCGRGHKGQMSRKGHKHKLGFEGGQMRLIRRIPKRGFKSFSTVKYEPINVGDLGVFDAGAEVTLASLRAAGMIKSRSGFVKILGGGEISKKLTVKAAAFSSSARAKIEAAGGSCEVTKN